MFSANIRIRNNKPYDTSGIILRRNGHRNAGPVLARAESVGGPECVLHRPGRSGSGPTPDSSLLNGQVLIDRVSFTKSI